MVHPREVLWEEKLGKPCKREEKHAHQLNLSYDNSRIEEKTGEELVLPGREDGIDRNSRTNASHLNTESYAEEKKIIVAARMLRKFFLSLIKMEQDKEAITE